MSRPSGALAPRRHAPATPLSIAIALGWCALGGVLIHDAAVIFEWISGPGYLVPSFAALDGLTPSQGVVATSVVLIALGVLFLVTAMMRRQPTAYPMDEAGTAWLTHTGAERLAESVAYDVDGVVSAGASANHRAVTVWVTGLGDTARLSEATRDRVRQAFSACAEVPPIRVRATKEGTGR